MRYIGISEQLFLSASVTGMYLKQLAKKQTSKQNNLAVCCKVVVCGAGGVLYQLWVAGGGCFLHV